MRALTVLGTRPEAIKLAPVIRALSSNADVDHLTCVTGQHREMLDQVLHLFQIRPDCDLGLMRPNQELSYITSAVLAGVDSVIHCFRPDWVIVQGDTSTALAAALAAFYRKVKVAHVEAGLRTGNPHSPWPEEMNRRLVGQIAALHFPPTQRADANLRDEGVPAALRLVTGNTVIDSLRWVAGQILGNPLLRSRCDEWFRFLDPAKRLILVTGHRRENLDGGLECVCQALLQIAERDDIEIVYPMHLNPAVRGICRAILHDHPGIHLIEPLEYLPFVYLMQRAYLIVTDSGGIQEEAPALGKPVLVTRDTTERPEAIEAGTARLIGTETGRLVAAISQLLDDGADYAAMAQARNPFGDGRASERIVGKLISAHRASSVEALVATC